MKIKKILLILTFLISLLLALCPWVTKDNAETRVLDAFYEEWEDVADGCGFNCFGCGIKESDKSLFGYKVVIEYACGMLASDSPEYHKTQNFFVSFLFTVHNY